MSKIISVASGFQYSVNIGYDLNNNDKLKNFIPTKSALNLLEDILLSTQITSTERARVLIGAYGKGKSHIVLMILSILMKKDLTLFEKLLPKLKQNPELLQIVSNYYDSNNKILPVIISGSNTSLPQAFLLALQRTLAEDDLLDIMPETNYQAALNVINRWKIDFPSTYVELQNKIDMPISKFTDALENYNTSSYELFEKVYPELTSGSVFNPFLGFDVVELYENAAKGLMSRGYSGIFVVYDEFSKFLEANISEASISDTKMLQDFAEKCNRSGNMQLHLMLICHKEISNYIDVLPKQKVDGWRGVSERFLHVHLNNNFTQTYEIISTVIQKDKNKWSDFVNEHLNEFDNLKHRYLNHSAFSELDEEDGENVITNCYPLHPITTFVLPRLSERVAQNERTLFTFLSAKGKNTLSDFLDNYNDKNFKVITPDCIYDYFEPLFRKEIYTSDFYETYQLTTSILSKLESGTLESKIVRTLSLIYILEQYEKIKPTKDEIVGIYSLEYSVEEIEKTINNLIDNELVIYLKRSNNYLRLKQTTGIDIKQEINNKMALIESKVIIKDVLNSVNFDSYMYPSRYNDEKEMTRYFSFEFIDAKEVSDETNWNIKCESVKADGVVYAIVPNENTEIQNLKESIISSSKKCINCVFVIPKKFYKINDIVNEFAAVSELRDKAISDKLLFDEFDVVYEDLKEVITNYIYTYTRPEELKSVYIYYGKQHNITRKASFTGLISDICNHMYYLTPVINNEAINKDDITSIANNSRKKIIAGLLRNELEPNLGLSGSGQEVSIMRSTLIRKGVLVEENNITKVNLLPNDHLLKNTLSVIVDFILELKQEKSKTLDLLYYKLTSAEYHIGMRKGLIPIYLSVVFHEFKQQLVLHDRFGQVPINAETILQINSNPSYFKLSYLDWNPEKESVINKIAEIFGDFINDTEKKVNSYDYVVTAMRRWYLSLPKYTKEIKQKSNGDTIDKRYASFIRLLKQNVGGHDLLFNKLPEVFGYKDDFNVGICENIAAAKEYYDSVLYDLKISLIQTVKNIFSTNLSSNRLAQYSLSSVIKDWYEALDDKVFEQLFADGTDKCLGLFRTITNDEETFIARLAKLVTDLRLEDWDQNKINEFIQKIKMYKNTAEQFHFVERQNESAISESYQISFEDDKGNQITKRFKKVENTKRGMLLHNAITANLESMGNSISEQEKRQILMEILKKLC